MYVEIALTISQVLLISNQPNWLSLPYRTETSACSTLKTPCSRLSQVKLCGIKAKNLFILSSSMNVLITKRASLSPWQEKGVWWSLPSGCRQSRSNKLTNRNLHQRKRSDMTWWDWCDSEIHFTKSFYWNNSSCLEHARVRSLTLTHDI